MVRAAGKAHRLFAALDDAGRNELIGDVYAAIGTRVHDGGEELTDDVVREAALAAGAGDWLAGGRRRALGRHGRAGHQVGARPGRTRRGLAGPLARLAPRGRVRPHRQPRSPGRGRRPAARPRAGAVADRGLLRGQAGPLVGPAASRSPRLVGARILPRALSRTGAPSVDRVPGDGRSTRRMVTMRYLALLGGDESARPAPGTPELRRAATTATCGSASRRPTPSSAGEALQPTAAARHGPPRRRRRAAGHRRALRRDRRGPRRLLRPGGRHARRRHRAGPRDPAPVPPAGSACARW